MRTIVATLLLVIGSAAGSGAQQSAATPAPRQETDLAPGLLPEPRAISRAIDFASPWLGAMTLRQRTGFIPTWAT
jgi:hypothetical protein